MEEAETIDKIMLKFDSEHLIKNIILMGEDDSILNIPIKNTIQDG